MKHVYLFSSGEYSDYEVCFLVESTRVVSEDEFKVHWLEAIKSKTEYVDSKLEAIGKQLGIAKQSEMYDYRYMVDTETLQKAKEEVGYKFKREADFFAEILTRRGFTILEFEEYNVDDLGQ